MSVVGRNRPKHRTPLLDWMEEQGLRDWDLAKKIGCGPMAISYWKWNQVLPDLIHARKLEIATQGAVPMLSWLGTPYGKERYDKVANWEKIARPGWAEWSEKKRRKAAKSEVKSDPGDAP